MRMDDQKDVLEAAAKYRSRGTVMQRGHYILATLGVCSVGILCLLFGFKDPLYVPIVLVITALVGNWLAKTVGAWYLRQATQLAEHAEKLRKAAEAGGATAAPADELRKAGNAGS